MKWTLLACLAFAAICPHAHAAQECGWLATSKVDQAFPEFAPWQTMVGGKVGSCKFVSTGGPANIFGANQTVEKSDAEAEDFVRSLKKDMAEDYEVQPAPELGKQGFSYKPKPGTEQPEGRSLFFVGHHKNVVVIGSMMMQKAVTQAQRASAEKLLVAALAIADDSRAIAAASQCPYFDEALLRRLLPGKDFNENVYGANSCMAQANGKAVIVSIVEDADAEELGSRIGSMTGGGCTKEPLPKLGKTAALEYNCKGGAPHATVRFANGEKLFDYSFAPDREPTAAERALLVELAEHAH